MKYIGIDPSTKTGIVVLNESGEVEYQTELSSKEKNDPERFMDLAKKIFIRIDSSLDNGEEYAICIEGFSYGSSGRGVSTQYGIGWLIRAELIRNGYTYTEVSPSAVKKFATGKGNEKKENMILPIFQRWGFEHPSDNVRDAYVLAKIAQGMNGISKLTKYQIEVLDKIQEGK
jgi:crossover junction endodeoxyribonuclease RuvC